MSEEIPEKYSQPLGCNVTRLPFGVSIVINGRPGRFPERRVLRLPMRVIGTPASDDGIGTEAGAVNNSS
jgi:hypothetical protein